MKRSVYDRNRFHLFRKTDCLLEAGRNRNIKFCAVFIIIQGSDNRGSLAIAGISILAVGEVKFLIFPTMEGLLPDMKLNSPSYKIRQLTVVCFSIQDRKGRAQSLVAG